jgi:hypothetical protein
MLLLPNMDIAQVLLYHRDNSEYSSSLLRQTYKLSLSLQPHSLALTLPQPSNSSDRSLTLVHSPFHQSSITLPFCAASLRLLLLFLFQILPTLPSQQPPSKFFQQITLLNPPLLQPTPQPSFILRQILNPKPPNIHQQLPPPPHIRTQHTLHKCRRALEREVLPLTLLATSTAETRRLGVNIGNRHVVYCFEVWS